MPRNPTVGLFILGLIVVFGLVWLKETVAPSTPGAATVAAVQQAVGPRAKDIKISGRYGFEDVDGSSDQDVQLVCGSVGRDRRTFAALVRVFGTRSTRTYGVDEFVLRPPPGRALLARETQLLGACASG